MNFDTADIRITYTVTGKHRAAWVAKKITEFSKRGVRTGTDPDDGGPVYSFRPDDVRAAAEKSPVGAISLGTATDPRVARDLARKARSDGAADVTINWRAQRHEIVTGKWSACGHGTIGIDSGPIPVASDFEAVADE